MASREPPYLSALLIVLIAACGRWVWRNAAALGILVAVAIGVWYALRLTDQTIRAITVSYLVIEGLKAIRGRVK